MSNSHTGQHPSPFDVENLLAAAGRGLLALCFIAIGGWHTACYDLVAAHLDTIGIPHAFIWLSIALPLAAGFGLLYGVRMQESALTLIAWLIMATLLLHHDFSSAGIGGYPNLKASLVNAGIIGSLLAILAMSDKQTGSLLSVTRYVTTARLLTAGRIILSAYFLCNAAWQWLYIDVRMEHVEASGGDPNSVWISIFLQLIGGLLILTGRYIRTGAALVAVPLIVSTVVVHGNLGPDAPYPPHTQVHQWFVKSSLLAGLLLISSRLERP